MSENPGLDKPDPYGQPGRPGPAAEPHAGPAAGPEDAAAGERPSPAYPPTPLETPPGYDQPDRPATPAFGQSAYQQPVGQAAPRYPAQPYQQQQYQQPQPYQQPQYQQPQYQQPQPYQQPQYQQPAYGEQKSKVAAGVLGILLGGLGIHNFYLGYTKKALVQLLLSVLSFGFLYVFMQIWGLIEGILILVGNDGFRTDARGIPLRD